MQLLTILVISIKYHDTTLVSILSMYRAALTLPNIISLSSSTGKKESVTVHLVPMVTVCVEIIVSCNCMEMMYSYSLVGEAG